MNENDGRSTDREAFLDKVTAELTEAAYLVALRHREEGSWIDLKLDLWDVLTSAVHRLRQQAPRGYPG
jgi:hypothetical protein